MKEDWKECKLGEIVEMNPTESIKKGTISKKIGMDLLQPFCRSISSFTTEAYSGGAKFRNKDTIMARITPCLENGKTAMVNILDDNEIGFGSTEYIVFRAKNNISDPYFIYYLITSSLIREPAIKSMVGSSGRQRVQTDVVANLSINLPPLATQQKIAKILSSLDDKIELNNKINDNLEQQAQAIFKSWFVDFEPFGGKMPDGWKVGKLSDLITVKYGKDHKKLNDGNYPVYGSGGIMRYVEKFLYDKESVLIPRKGTLNNVFYINEPFWSVDTMFYTEMKKENIAKYVYFFVKGKDLNSMNAGSAVPSMTTEILNAIEVVIPSDEYLEKFENIVSPMFKQIKQCIIENENLASIRDTLLPKLMNGEIETNSNIISKR